MINSSGAGSHGPSVWYSEEHTPLQHYLIVAHGSKGLELPDILSDYGEEILPVFVSEEAAQEFLSLSSLGKRWYVRGFSGGELVSVLFAFHGSHEFTARNPKPPTCHLSTSLASDPSQLSDPRIGRLDPRGKAHGSRQGPDNGQ